MPDRLDPYRRKRDPARTPEPFGPAGGSREEPLAWRPFVVQMHAARRLHWDFRLELDGTLRSWAVPKGPSYDPADKRMAVEVEDHPVEYADFEGTIPAGNYGAGAVIVWDRGTWRPHGDPREGLAEGKLVFDLAGYKLRGEWTLVRTRREGSKQQWLLLKHRDALAGPGRALADTSVLTGRTLADVAAGDHRAEAALAEARRLGARPHQAGASPTARRGARERRGRGAPDDGLMLAEAAAAPFSDPGWIFEIKYDGYRVLAGREGDHASVRYRSGGDATALFPELRRALELLPAEATVDGELVVLAPDGRPSFEALQQRAALRGGEIARAAVERPATLFAFDLLALGPLDLRALPLRDRKRLLASLVPRLGPVRYADHVEGRGEDLFREVQARGLEGIVAKRADSPYRAGRSPAWRKIRADRTADLAVAGFTRGRGARGALGALLLASREGEGWRFAGSVGAGIPAAALADLRARLSPAARRTPPCAGPVPRGRGVTWVEPQVVVEVRFKEWTRDGLLRQPVFARVRDDKRPEEAVRDEPARPSPPRAAPPARAAAAGGAEPGAPRVTVSNPEKVYFPEDDITKGDVVAYYREIAPFMLPWLADRPIVLTRFPDGIHGKSFFQKDAPEWRPGWMRTATLRSEDGRDLDHFLVDDADGLAWIANLGAIPIHVVAARASALDRPDWCVVDLDPKEAPFAHVVRLALALGELCDELGLPSYPKTTGQQGLHVLVPLGGQLDHGQARTLGELLARALEREHAAVATTARAVGARGGRVYLDYLQNGFGKTIAAPYAVRPRPGAPVSAPLRWSEVGGRLDPARFTIRTVPARARRLRADPALPVLRGSPDLARALARLRERLAVPGAPASPRR